MVTKLSDQRFQLRIPTAAVLTFRDWWSRRSNRFILSDERLEHLKLLERFGTCMSLKRLNGAQRLNDLN
jgi:hypothetical protein